MMKIYTAKDGDRLDLIVYKEYGTLDMLYAVVKLNCDLPVILNAGDEVLLPPVSVTKSKGKRLW